jgi:hypothetical protein
MDASLDAAISPPRPDELNRLWQHGLHEERLFHDRLNYFAAMQVGLLGVFAILYNKEPSPGVFAPLTAAALALDLLWLRGQARHWRYCVHVHEQLKAALPDFRRTIAAFNTDGRTEGMYITRPLAVGVPVLFAATWLALFAWVVVRTRVAP